ncbi:MAG: response regulator transcription factor [Chloroflexi bacterium]|nr:response regulator transcription factor [Chloroflexota bacterium]
MHVLIADDDRRLSRLLERGLEAEGHRVDLAADGAEALALARQGGFDVIVLDVMMPLADGFAVVRELRDRADDTPVLMLTARGEVEDRVRGLDLGADDYLVKPFDFDELLARLRALDRRRSGAEGATLSAGPITVDLLKREARIHERSLELTPTEFRLLEFLVRHAGQALSRRRILAHVWGYADEPDTNAVDLYIHYLRRKLGAADAIRTVRGVGYRIDADA